ncbi:uncharacterized protein LOC114867098 [Betta splendens]|uniref:Uncharacterized protein LOC114867098 n=1 Tax=Betta splendens TaxID=158456 RepID=A0A6P7P6X7_BETSP|nr:uncharacterized protein LOC114867098 [Betta splendens]XP_055360774.1 uncharacterized protein LOC114867098 [Betta splendens]
MRLFSRMRPPSDLMRPCCVQACVQGRPTVQKPTEEMIRLFKVKLQLSLVKTCPSDTITQTMRNYSLVPALLLCSVCWIGAFDFHAVDVQPGDGVTLLCSNFSAAQTQIVWFRAVKKLKPACICFMFSPPEPASFCGGFTSLTFEATTNISTLFLKIKGVNLSDSGLYFCGYNQGSDPVIVSATYVEVQGSDSYTAVKQISGIFGGLTVFLTLLIVGLVVRIKKLQDHTEEHSPQNTRSQGSDDLNYAVVSFRPKSSRNLSTASESKVENNAIYSATRAEEAPGTNANQLCAGKDFGHGSVETLNPSEARTKALVQH